MPQNGSIHALVLWDNNLKFSSFYGKISKPLFLFLIFFSNYWKYLVHHNKSRKKIKQSNQFFQSTDLYFYWFFHLILVRVQWSPLRGKNLKGIPSPNGLCWVGGSSMASVRRMKGRKVAKRGNTSFITSSSGKISRHSLGRKIWVIQTEFFYFYFEN